MNPPPTFYRDSRDPKRFFYVPGKPGPERAPDGRPTLQLWVTDNDARLQLGSQWALTEQELQALRRTVAARFPPLRPNDVDLQPAPAQVKQVELLLQNGDGLTAIATSTSSGFVPYTALFAVPLTADQKADAISALHGRTGFLAVRYQGSVLDEHGSWEPIERTTDVGSWFSAGRGSDHIRVVPTNYITQPTPSTTQMVTFTVEEAVKTAPLAFIQLEWGSANTTLRPPAFAPVSLPLTDAPPRCTTHYTVGNPAYVASLAASPKEETVTLTPDVLGLAEIVVSAPAYREAEAREVRVTVHYVPQGAGTEDERTVYLRGDQWEERWWVVTRAPTLDGTLEVTVKITHSDARVDTVPRYRQEHGTVQLAPPASR
jgi:hypothetical protein